MKIQTLKESLLGLHLKTMAGILEEILKKGAQENLSAADLLLILTSQEMASREQRPVKTRLSQAFKTCS
jgi:hypothetical protein